MLEGNWGPSVNFRGTLVLRRSPRLAMLHLPRPISYKETTAPSETPVLRRSPRLAMLYLLRPISYKETRARRVFKKVHRRPTPVAPVEEWTNVQMQPCHKNRSCLLVVVAVLLLAIFAGLRVKVMKQWSSETLDRPGNQTIQKISGGVQNLENFWESAADGLPELLAHPGHGDVPPGPALCDGLVPLLCAQKLLFIGHEILQRDLEGQIQEENFALKSSGASVVRRSKPFYSGAKLCSLGFCWDYSRSPDIILERRLMPGNCWAMGGAQGFVVIKLSEAISPTAVTLAHISKMASPYGTISSAPRQFAIYGLRDAFEEEEKGILLGSFIYKNNSFPVQMFQLKRSKEGPFPYLMVKILSNHGHPNYTCIYSVRVHGQRINRISYNEQEDLDHPFHLLLWLMKARLAEWFYAT